MNINTTNSHYLPTTGNSSVSLAAVISFEVINSLVLTISVYMTACVVTYGFVAGAWSKKQQTSTPKGQLDRGIIYALCVIGVAADLPRLVLTAILHATKIDPGDTNCDVLVDVTTTAWSMAYLTKYIFLWYRQHTINCNPAVKVFTSRWAKGISYAHIVIFMGLYLVTTLLYVDKTTFRNSQYGCMLVLLPRNGTNQDVAGIRIVRTNLLVASQITSQLAMLGLFTYPLYRSWLRRKKITETSAVTTPNLENKKLDSIQTLLQRSAAATAITCLSDVIVTVVWYETRDNSSVAITITYYNISLVIYSFCTMATFSFRRDILTVFYTLTRGIFRGGQ